MRCPMRGKRAARRACVRGKRAGAHALPVPVSFLPPYGEQARRAGQCLTRFGSRRACHEQRTNNADGGTRGGRRGGARLCERVVPGRPSRVARGEGDEAGAALRARGARASIAWHGAAASEELLVLVLLATA